MVRFFNGGRRSLLLVTCQIYFCFWKCWMWKYIFLICHICLGVPSFDLLIPKLKNSNIRCLCVYNFSRLLCRPRRITTSWPYLCFLGNTCATYISEEKLAGEHSKTENPQIDELPKNWFKILFYNWQVKKTIIISSFTIRHFQQNKLNHWPCISG